MQHLNKQGSVIIPMHRPRNKGIKKLQEILVARMTHSMVRNPTPPVLARLCPIPWAHPETAVTFRSMGLVIATEYQRGVLSWALCDWTLSLLSTGDNAATKEFSKTGGLCLAGFLCSASHQPRSLTLMQETFPATKIGWSSTIRALAGECASGVQCAYLHAKGSCRGGVTGTCCKATQRGACSH